MAAGKFMPSLEDGRADSLNSHRERTDIGRPRPGAASATMRSLSAPDPQADGPTPRGCQPEFGQTDPADLRPKRMRPNGPPPRAESAGRRDQPGGGTRQPLPIVTATICV